VQKHKLKDSPKS